MSVNLLYRQKADGSLILRPPFQRNLVWNDDQKSFLVDSILRGLPVPEIYIQTDTTADGVETTVVVDGQQRITSCIEFLQDTLRLTQSVDIGERWRGRIFKELDDDLKVRFRSFELIARKLPNVDNAVMREIFRRLNQTVEALEAQELRHAAYTGPFVSLVEAAAAQKVLGEIGVFSAKDYLRRRNDEFFAECCFAISSKAFPNKKDGLDDLFLTYEKQGVPADSLNNLERRLGRVFSMLTLIAGSLRRTRFRNKSDFYSLVVFLARWAERLPLNESSAEPFLLMAKTFSDRVNEIKRQEGNSQSIDSLVSDPLGAEAVRYLRAVERAASDRLSRVRRDEALTAIFGRFFEAQKSTELEQADASWRLEPNGEDDELDDVGPDSLAAERDHMQEVLLAADSDGQ